MAKFKRCVKSTPLLNVFEVAPALTTPVTGPGTRQNRDAQLGHRPLQCYDRGKLNQRFGMGRTRCP